MAIYGIPAPGDSRVVGFGSSRHTLSLLERDTPAEGVAQLAGGLARCRYGGSAYRAVLYSSAATTQRIKIGVWL